LKNHHGCPVQGTINAVSGKWKILAIWQLGFGPQRFAKLRKLLPGVSEKVLTAQLRQLEADGIVRRETTRTSPPQVTYSLSGAGEELIEPMSILCAWGYPPPRHPAEPAPLSRGRKGGRQLTAADARKPDNAADSRMSIVARTPGTADPRLKSRVPDGDAKLFSTVMNRRNFLGSAAAAGLSGCAHKSRVARLPSFEVVPRLMPIRAELDRIFRVTVCLRPFRAAGATAGRRTRRRQDGRAQLRAWRQRLVAVVGVEQHRGREKPWQLANRTWRSSDAARWG